MRGKDTTVTEESEDKIDFLRKTNYKIILDGHHLNDTGEMISISSEYVLKYLA